MRIRAATSSDAEALSRVLQDLVTAGKRHKPADADFARQQYLDHPAQIRCSLALDAAGEILGFQSLKIARSDNPYGTPLGWGIIGTHIRPLAARQGVGRQLFPVTRAAAQEAGLLAIEAYIGADNAGAIAYYEALGFATYRPVPGVDCKRLILSPEAATR